MASYKILERHQHRQEAYLDREQGIKSNGGWRTNVQSQGSGSWEAEAGELLLG